MVTLRAATEADRGPVIWMAREFFRATDYGKVVRPDLPHLEALYTVALEQGVIVVADANLQVPGTGLVGFLALVLLEHTLSGERYAEELAWWVSPGWRTGSVGLRLLSWAEDWIRAQGVYMVKMVAPAGGRVGATYERLGYQAIEVAYLKRF